MALYTTVVHSMIAVLSDKTLFFWSRRVFKQHTDLVLLDLDCSGAHALGIHQGFGDLQRRVPHIGCHCTLSFYSGMKLFDLPEIAFK